MSSRMNSGQLAIDRHILFHARGRESSNVDTLAEEQAKRRSTKVKHANLFALFDMLALLDRNIAGRHLYHADTNEAQKTNGGVISLDEDQCTCRRRCQVCLDSNLHIGVGILG